MSYPANRTLNRQIAQALYALKRQYGGTVDVYSLAGSQTDPRTGETTVQKTVTRLDRAVILPVKIARDAKRSISAISANKQMVMGGFYDSGTRMFILDRRDAPDLVLDKDAWLVYGGRKYAIDSIQEFEFDAAWVVVGKVLLGEIPEQMHRLYADTSLELLDRTCESVGLVHTAAGENMLVLTQDLLAGLVFSPAADASLELLQAAIGGKAMSVDAAVQLILTDWARQAVKVGSAADLLILCDQALLSLRYGRGETSSVSLLQDATSVLHHRYSLTVTSDVAVADVAAVERI